jgi:hypothetical protein
MIDGADAGDILTVDLDAAWWPLGDGTDAPADIADALATRLVPELKGPEGVALKASLVSFAEWSQSLSAGSRRSFALVRTPQLGRVDALLSMRFTDSMEGVYERYLSLTQDQRSTDTVDLVNQQVFEYALPLGRAIAIHDVLVIRSGGLQQPARERCTLALFPQERPVLIEFHLATLDLALFDDIVDYAVTIASGLNPGVPGLLQYDGVP